MAGLGGKNWSFQEEVTSSDVNGFLADQVVMRFADATARTAGFGGSGEPTLAEGMVSYLDDVNRLEVYNGSSWQIAGGRIVQVVDATYSTSTSSSVTTYANTGLTATITPTSATNKVLVIVSMNGCQKDPTNANNGLNMRLTINGTPTIQFATILCWTNSASWNTGSASLSYTHSPASTSATTYKIEFANNFASASVIICANNVTSTMALMEVAA